MSQVDKTDVSFMMQALKLASCGLYTSYPNPAVGCVIVRNGKVIGKGYHHCAGQPHAEIMALADANYDVEGATVYVTLEPCSHYGRTPPCALKLVEMKVARVVVAADDPNPKVNGKGFQILRDAGIEVVQHVLEKESLFQNRAFFKSIQTSYPYVSVKVAMSLDGKTALSDGSSKWITGDSSRQKVQDIRAKSDCIVTGVNTVIADDPLLNVRYESLRGKYRKKIDRDFIRQPLKVVLDTNSRLDIEKYRIFKDGNVLLVNGTTDSVQIGQIRRENENVTRIFMPIRDNYIDLEYLLKHLGSMNIRRVMVEAGAQLTSAFINSGFTDEIYAFISGKFMGKDGRNAFILENALSMDKCQSYTLYRTKRYDNDVLLHYIIGK
ncbi:MAG: bifunctional diaminohydroxyphosphoribosylaminopyrimidine deaminase/5-amino-6-(5-phosphoribosylamino)uracil reductase RibD [Succinivibrio sp.]